MKKKQRSRAGQARTFGARWIAAAAVGLIVLSGGTGARAQNESVQDMIQQLQVKRTRSLRNLNVESAAASSEPRPSLSLQIQFDFDSANVRPESMAALERLSRAVGSAELATHRFAIEGHTDAQGSADYNLRLSELRANRVKDILVQAGVDPNRLHTLGKGSSDPANPGDPRSAANRRVKIVNLD